MNHHSDQIITDSEEMRSILAEGKFTVLALSDGNDPYVLSLNYGLDPQEDILYFYSGKSGTKIDYLKSNPYVCGTVVLDGGFQKNTHHYQSVVYRGLVEVVHNGAEKEKALMILHSHLNDRSMNTAASLSAESDHSDSMLLMKLTIDEMTGKRNPF